MKILMVCIGNICRSPIAEGVMRHLIQQNNLDWEVDSAATEPYHIGEPPHISSQKVCKEKGIDISGQKARLFKKEDLLYYDKIYAMADEVMGRIKKIGGKSFDYKNTDLFLNELYPGANKSVPDPWYGDEDGYYPVYDMIEEACTVILKKYNQ